MMTSDCEFREFGKIARLFRPCVITEKIDGTNAQICIVQSLSPEPGAIAHRSLGDAGNLSMFVGSRTRWITPENDNHGFARWVKEHATEDGLWQLGPGRHFGEWWGQGIQRGYGMKSKVFSLFNTSRWVNPAIVLDPGSKQQHCPTCCRVVPVLYQGPFDTDTVQGCLDDLKTRGSLAAPGFMRPEGVVVYHIAGDHAYKVTLENDGLPKSLVDKAE